LIISSSMDLAMFRMHLQDNTTLSQGSIFEYTTAISKFLSDDPDINSVEAYNKFILDYTFKKRCTHYYSAIRAYIKFKFPKIGIPETSCLTTFSVLAYARILLGREGILLRTRSWRSSII